MSPSASSRTIDMINTNLERVQQADSETPVVCDVKVSDQGGDSKKQ
jgi:hypothetical protein